MGHLSITLELRDRPCLVVGGGDVARRKVEALLRADARVTLIAPDVDDAIRPHDRLVVHKRAFDPSDIGEADLVFACTNDAGVNAAVAAAAREAGAWVNVADDPAACTFFVNATLSRGALTIGVSTGGASPALGRRIRRELEDRYGEAYEPFVELLGRLRAEVVALEPDPEKRRTLFARLAALPGEDICAAGGPEALERAMRELLAPAEAKD